MSSPPGRTSRRAHPRVPLRVRVHLEFEAARCFLSEATANLSAGGMFVSSGHPEPVGTQVRFESRLTPQGPLLRGTARVVWVRGPEREAEAPAGMGIEFLELEPELRELLAELGDAFEGEGMPAVERALRAAAETWMRREMEDETTSELQPLEPGGASTGAASTGAASGATTMLRVSAMAEMTPTPPELPRPRAAAVDAGGAGAAAGLADDAAAPLLEAPPPAQRAGGPRIGFGLVLLAAVAAAWFFWPPLARRVTHLPVDAGGERALRSPAGAVPRVAPVAAEVPPPLAEPAAEVPAIPEASPPAESTDGEAPTATAENAGAPAPDAPPFAGLSSVAWRQIPDGLVVVLRTEGAPGADAVRHFRAAQDPPREVVQLFGAEHAYPLPSISVGSPLLAQIRFGFHAGADGNEQRVVFDLPDRTVGIRSVDRQNGAVEVVLVAE